MLAPRNHGEGVTDDGRLKRHFLKQPEVRPDIDKSGPFNRYLSGHNKPSAKTL
jgi:hypothetical protein